jgi:hypothetical protein
MIVGTGAKIEWLVTVEGEPKTATGGWTGLDRVGRVMFHDGLRHREVAEAMSTSLRTTIILGLAVKGHRRTFLLVFAKPVMSPDACGMSLVVVGT